VALADGDELGPALIACGVISEWFEPCAKSSAEPAPFDEQTQLTKEVARIGDAIDAGAVAFGVDVFEDDGLFGGHEKTLRRRRCRPNF